MTSVPKSAEASAVAEIVLAAIVDGRGRVLIQPRAGDRALAGTWELPGGKVRPGESHETALAREVAEETGVAVRVGELVGALCHAYPDRRVALYAYLCEPVGCVRPVRWARWSTPGEYAAMAMPEANAGIVHALERALAARPAGKELLDTDSSISYK
jgi:mutator protein MutT